jgi:deoxyribonuclease-4
VRDISLHIRLEDTIVEVAQKAARLDLPIFQCFFLHQETHRFIHPSYYQVNDFKKMRNQFNQLFVHASYWTNFASIHDISLYIFKRELRLAKQLGFTHIILHPGSAKGAPDKTLGIDSLARRLNSILKYEQDITIVLENTAHGNLSIGGDLVDFKAILEKIDYPEKISFCLDTVHAHVFGYALDNLQGQQQFFNTVEQTIGFERIALIHLNNTDQPIGSCMDRHLLLDRGILPIEALRSFVLHPSIRDVPIIMELPVVDEGIEKEMLKLVSSWHQ